MCNTLELDSQRQLGVNICICMASFCSTHKLKRHDKENGREMLLIVAVVLPSREGQKKKTPSIKMVLCAHVTAAEQLVRHSWFKKLCCLILVLVADGATTGTKAMSGLKLFL